MESLHIFFLNLVPFEFITPKDSSYFYYIDDILLINLQNNDFTKITDRLNKMEPTIDFNYKLETNNTLTFLDILMINNNKLEFNTYFIKPR